MSSSSTGNRKPIVLTEDLIDEWQKRTGKPRELLEEMLKLHYKYVNHLINNEPTAVIIMFPNLGKLRFNYFMYKSSISGRSAETLKPMTDKFEVLQEIMRVEGNEIMNFNRPLLVKQFFKRTRKTIRGVYNKYYQYWLELERYHNEWFMNKHGKDDI